MTQWLVMESATGLVYHLATDGCEADEAYRLFAEKVQGLDVSGDFDTGNVDVELHELEELEVGGVCPVWQDE